MKDLISIIIPIYNIEQYLETCLDSVIANNYMPMEIILVNDGSTDSSGDICERYACNDERFVYIEQENGGLVLSRKKGLEYARGKYVIFVDGDDYVEPDMIEKMHEHMVKYDVDFVHANCIENGRNNCYVREKKVFSSEVLTLERRKKILLENVLGLPSDSEFVSIVEPSIYSKIFKREFIKKCYSKLPDQQQYGEDLLCLFYEVLYCKNMVWIPDAYYHYRIRLGSLSHRTDSYLSATDIMMLSKYIIALCEGEVEDDVFLWKIKGWALSNMLGAIQRAFPNQISTDYRFRLKDNGISKGSKIVLYGAGELGKSLYRKLVKSQDVNLVAWVDQNAGKFENTTGQIINPMRLLDVEYDRVLIAVKNVKYVTEIKDELKKIGVEEKKIIWIWPKIEIGFWIS